MGKLIDAVQKNDIQQVIILLKTDYQGGILHKCSPLVNDETDSSGFPPLHLAAQYGFIKIVELLLKAGAKVNHADKNGCTPLYMSAQEGKVESIQTLLQAGAKVDQPENNGATPLFIAAEKGHANAIQILLNGGAKVDEPRKDGKTPLFIAAEKGHANAIQTLLKAGAKVDHSTKDRKTPLLIATENGYIGAIKALLKGGAKVNQAMQIGITIATEGVAPLYIASEKGYIDVMLALLEGGANVDQSVRGGTTPLHIAAQSSKESIQQVLFGDELDQSLPIGATPLYIAAQKNHIGVVQALLGADADVDQATKAGKTPLYIAAQKGHVEIIQTLLKAGAKIDQPNKKGEFTPLYVAIYEGKIEVVRVLLQWNANIYAKTKKNDKTPLDIAKEKGDFEIIKLLKEQIKQQNKLKTSSVILSDSQDPIPESKYEPIFNTQISPSLEAKPMPGKVELSFSFSIKYSELTIGKELGRGGFGVVYQGTYRHNEVAIKQLHLAKPSTEALEEFQHEMEIMNRLRYPQIVSLYGVYTEPNYGIVMEYMPNGSLYQVLRNKQPLEWSVRTSIAVDITKGVAFLHKENILHRDLKSLNVVLDEHMKAKLMDFGLAKIKDETTRLSSNSNSNSVVGSLLWMAPELFKRKAQCTSKTDIYSLGMTLWELASGEVPFKDAANASIAVQWVQQGDREEIPNDCPPKISKLIAFCWNAEAEKRPTADEAVKQLLSVELKQEQEETSNFSYRGNFDSRLK